MRSRMAAALLVAGAFGLGLGLGGHLPRVPDHTPAVRAVVGTVALGLDFTTIARRTTPAVVNISALQVYRTTSSPFFSDPFFREFFGRDLPFRMPQEERKTSLGSGVVINSGGLIVTNNHVVEQARRIVVTTPDGRRHEAQIVGADPATDIAAVHIGGSGHAPLPWGDSDSASVGKYVLAVGNPFQLSQTVTMGIISATGRSNIGIVDYEDFIQTDAAINPGNSGGVLVNGDAELIGINTAIYSETGGYQGIGFAVPSNLARRVVEQLVRHGRVIRGWVGITNVRDIDAKLARALGMSDTRGAHVWELLRGSPADKAGLEPGDVVIALDGQRILDAAGLRRALAEARVGATLRVTLLRERRRFELSPDVLEARPSA